MPATIQNAGKDTQYLVRFDNDRNGFSDDIIFSNVTDSKLFEDCYVSNLPTEKCKTWLFEQASGTTIYTVDAIQYYTAKETKGKLCNHTSTAVWEPGITALTSKLEQLKANISSLKADEIMAYARTAFDYITGETETGEAQNHLFMMLSSLSEASSPRILTDDQLKFIKDYAWQHRFSVLTDLDFDLVDTDETVSASEHIDQFNDKCFTPSKQYCVSTNNAVTFSDAELVQIHRTFGGFQVCE